MKNTSAEIALLAPVPQAHLVAGCAVAEAEGRVAFGSNAFEVFARLEKERKGMLVDAYIYASHTGVRGFQVSWYARYIGYVHSVGHGQSSFGAHPAGMRYRPPSTLNYVTDNEGKWALFWEVEELRLLGQDETIRLVHLTGVGKKKAYGKWFVPEGPTLIEHPCEQPET